VLLRVSVIQQCFSMVGKKLGILGKKVFRFLGFKVFFKLFLGFNVRRPGAKL